MTIQEIFIANLKECRKDRKISQMKLAELCESSTGYIGEIESGKRFPSVAMIERIARALHIESYCLFKNEPVNPACSGQAKLARSQKKAMLDRMNLALAKVLDEF